MTREHVEDGADGGWIAVVVFLLCLIGLLGLGVYALVRPVIEAL